MKTKIPFFCRMRFHNWYHGNFQTGEISKFNGDHIGVTGRDCMECHKKQILKNGEWVDVKSFDKQDLGSEE